MARQSNKNRYLVDPKKLEASIRNLHRGPFQDILTEFLERRPSGLSLKRFAEEYPDRWVGAIDKIAQLSGYHPKIEHEHTGEIAHRVTAMSDVELQMQLTEVNRKIDQLQAIPGSFEEVGDDPSTGGTIAVADESRRQGTG